MEQSLLFSQSPLCPLAVDVISDGRSYYFYMYDLDYANEQLYAHSACWLKNLVEASDVYDEDCSDGHQPLMPTAYIKDQDLTPWDEGDLEIVWSKEGHIASLYYQGELYSIIPSWADGQDFCGYTKNVVENTMLGWKLEDVADVFEQRLSDSRDFWMQEFNLVWKDYHSPYVDELCQYFGGIDACFDIHKDQFPSRILITFEKEEKVYAFTVGMGMFSMPNADRYYDDYQSYARVEFAVVVDKKSCSNDDLYAIYSMLATLCEHPWKDMDCLADQHIVDVPILEANHCILMDDDHYAQPFDLSLKQEGVHLMWVVPLDDEDYKQVQEEKHAFVKQLIKEDRK